LLCVAELLGDGQAEVIEQVCQFLVEFQADCGDRWYAETAELIAGPVEGEVGCAVWAIPDHCVQRRVEHDGRLVPVHALGDGVVAYEVEGPFAVSQARRMTLWAWFFQ